VIDKTNSAARKAVSNRICQRRAGLPWPSSAYIQLAHFDDVSPSRSLGSVPKKLNLTHDKSCAFADQKKCTIQREIETKKLKPGLVAFYSSRPGNGAGLFSEEKISKGGLRADFL